MNNVEPTVQQLLDLTGKRALITGATGHLGGALSRALAEAGAAVAATSRYRDRAETVAAGLPSPGGARHAGVALDQTDADSIAAGFDAAAAALGGLDIVVNNGHAALAEDLSTVSFQQFAEQQKIVAGYFEMARLLRNHVVDRKVDGNVIMLGSMYGQVASYPEVYAGRTPASPVAYHALKGGILQLTRHLAVYWAGDGVRVNTLSPGPFPAASQDEQVIARLKPKVPLGRIGTPEELKGAVVFLASSASSYMTGQNLVIDGGWTAW